MMLAVTASSILYSKFFGGFNAVNLLRSGLLLFLLGLCTFLAYLHSAVMVAVALGIIGLSYGVLYSTLFSITLHDISYENTSEASGILYFSNILGGALGVAFIGLSFSLHKSESVSRTLFLGVHSMLISCSVLICLCLIAALFLIKKKSISA